MPLQWFVIVTAGINHQHEHYGPIVEDEWMTYQPQHYQIVMPDEYQQLGQLPLDKVHGGALTLEVVPDWDAQVVTEGTSLLNCFVERFDESAPQLPIFRNLTFLTGFR